MSQPVTEYVIERVGAIWTPEDAMFVLDKIAQIEQLAADLAALKCEAKPGKETAQ